MAPLPNNPAPLPLTVNPQDSPPLLAVDNLGRRHPQASGQWLIRGISLALQPGHCLAVQGPSGAGKSVLLRALAMLDPVDEGQVTWRGDVVLPAQIPSYRAQVIYLHQQSVCWEGSVRENLQQPFRLRRHRAKRSYSEEKSLGLLHAAGREAAFLDKPALELSGGERQVLSVVRALQLDPVVLLLDEPTAAMDPATTEQVEGLIATWRSSQRACIWVSHSRSQAERVADQVMYLH